LQRRRYTEIRGKEKIKNEDAARGAGIGRRGAVYGGGREDSEEGCG
jgi:hypothetical protein